MLGSLFTKVTTSVTSYAASTSAGKSFAVKPKLQELVELSRTELAGAKSKLAALESIKKVPKLNKAVRDLSKAADAVVDELASDASLDILADVIGNHLKDFAGIEDMKEKLPKMASIKKMQNFALDLIDVENYQKLADLFTDLEEFADIDEKERQQEILESLEDRTLTQAIATENSKLNVTKIHADVKKMSQAVCTELKLTKAESDAVIGLFDGLVKKHLKTFNGIREQLVAHLPAFLDAEVTRLRKAHPELAALEAKKPAITVKFQPKKAATKTGTKAAPKAKAAEKPQNKRKATDSSQEEEQEGRKFVARKT